MQTFISHYSKVAILLSGLLTAIYFYKWYKRNVVDIVDTEQEEGKEMFVNELGELEFKTENKNYEHKTI